jgi:pimeloyl-ACP methyl ester carboxylesterase
MTRRAAGCGAGLLLAAVVAAVLPAVPEAPPAPERAWWRESGILPGSFERGGVRYRFVRKGSGAAVVLLHGFASSVYTWKDVIPALAGAHDVVAFDFPGFGGSSIPRPLEAGRYPADVIAVMDALGIARASLVGNSLGGAVAVMVAAERPERVERLVLIDSAGFNYAAADRPWLLRAMGSPAAAAVVERLPVKRRLIAQGLRQVFHDDAKVTDERIDAYARPMMRPGAIAAAAGVLRGRPPAPIEAQLRRVRAPALVIWGADDGWIPPAHARRFAEALPGAEVAMIEDCGHVPQEEKPAEVARIVAGFTRPGTD